MKRVIARLFAMLVIALGAFVSVAAPAQAAQKTVTIEIGNWWCVKDGARKGSVSSVLIAAIPSNSPPAQWVSGNHTSLNVLYSSSGSKVPVYATVKCKTWWLDPGYYAYVTGGRWVDSNDSATWWTF